MTEFARYSFSYEFNKESSTDLILSRDNPDNKMKAVELIFICNDRLLNRGVKLAALGGLTMREQEAKFEFSCSDEFANDMGNFRAIKKIEKIKAIL